MFIPRDLLVCGAHDAGVILFDTSDPVHPVRLSHFDNPLVGNHHSTAFSNDGNTLVLDDEVYTERRAGGTGQPSGALWFYDTSDPRAPEERGFFQLSRPTADPVAIGAGVNGRRDRPTGDVESMAEAENRS